MLPVIPSIKQYFVSTLAVLRADFDPCSERGRLVREAIGTLGMKAATLGLAFLANVIYARALGSYGYGLFSYVIAWSALVAVPVDLGLRDYVLREAAVSPTAEICSAWLRWADRRLWISGLAGAGALVLLGYLLAPSPQAVVLFTIAAALPLINSLAGIRQSTLRAAGKTLMSQWPILLATPVCTLLLIVAWWLMTGRLTPVVLMVSTLAGTLAGWAILAAQTSSGRAHSGPYPASASLRSALPFLWLSALFLLNSRADLIMLGAIKGPQAAGIYAVVMRSAESIGIVLAAVNTVIAPRLAAYYSSGKHAELQRLITASAQRSTLLVMAPVLVLTGAGKPLLSVIFGEEYTSGAMALAILAATQLFNVAAGSVGLILNMTGLERITAWGVGTAAGLNVVLNAVLIPSWGIEGAAVASAVSMVFWNSLLWLAVRQRLGLRPSALGI